MKTEIEETRQRGRPKKTWWDYIKRDMESFGLSDEDAEDRDHWRLKIKEEKSQPRFNWKMVIKSVCACMRVCVFWTIFRNCCVGNYSGSVFSERILECIPMTYFLPGMCSFNKLLDSYYEL